MKKQSSPSATGITEPTGFNQKVLIE